MTREILTTVALAAILAGFVGLLGGRVKGRMIGITLDVAGLLLLANCQGTDYGFFAGAEQLIFQLPAFVVFILLLAGICRKNEIKELEGFAGLAKKMPYTFLLLILLGLFIIGCPGTGTFSAYMLGLASLMAGFLHAFDIAGLVGLSLGIFLLAYMLFDIYRRMLVWGQTPSQTPSQEASVQEASVQEAPSQETPSQEGQTKSRKTPSPMALLAFVVLIVLTVFSVYQAPVINLITKAYGAIKM